MKFGKTRHIHFVGIGGIGMSGLAIIMRNLKFRVTGSDLHLSEITRMLEKTGIAVQHGHRKEAVKGADVVVFSTAVKADNPELVEAQKRGIPVIHRGELLAELTRAKIAICISGTHGKTTTTSIVGEVLEKGGLAPTTVVGGIIRGKKQAQYGKGNYLVCEADESDKSFLRLYPSYAVITNIEPEHLDHYKDLEEIKEHFSYFANHVPFWGVTFLGVDSPGSVEIRERIYRKTITFGFNEHADIRAIDVNVRKHRCSFHVAYFKRKTGRFTIQLLGKHNVTNALAAIGIGFELGISETKIRKALREFCGVHRRIEYLGDLKGIKLFDDYGHHPTEIAVTLQTIREYYPKSRIIAVFQPHRYTRTYYLFNEFALAFLYADIVLVTDIYAAHEIPIPGVSGESLVKRISKEHTYVRFMPSFDDVVAFLTKEAQRGDIVVIQGAGDIKRLPDRLIKEFS
jgi:UDP-N-acetylmuramate--alanine ligase